MSPKYLTITLSIVLLVALSAEKVGAAASFTTQLPQIADPVRGVPNDWWADIVLGKPDFTGLSPYDVTDNRVFNPGGVVIDRSVTPNRIYVYDGGNNRILGLHVGNQSSQHAELVLGQPGLDDYSGCNGDSNFQHYPQRAVASAATLCTLPEYQISPREGGSFANMVVDSHGNLYVPDFYNNRVLLYNSPFETDTIADDVWGQADFSGNECNRNYGWYRSSAFTLCLASTRNNDGFGGGVEIDSANNLWVADNQNNRVIRFPYNPATGRPHHMADLVLGQPDFQTNKSGRTINQMWAPAAVRVNTAGDVYVADTKNNRILIFQPPFSNGMEATTTLGSGLRLPSSIEFDQNGNIWVSDSGNHQLLRFTPDKVIDRVLFKDVPNYDKFCGGHYTGNGPEFYYPGPDVYLDSANTCESKGSIGIDSDGNIWVTGSGFLQDVRRYPAPFPTPQAGIAHSADVQLFQGYSPGAVNFVSERGLSDPRGIAKWNDQLIVSDGTRILFWNGAPASLTNGKAADGVIIAPNFNTPMNPPIGTIKVDGQNRLWVLNINTVGVYHLPLVGGDIPFYTLQAPIAAKESFSLASNLDVGGMLVDKDGKYLWLSDPLNHRVIRIVNPLTNPKVDIVLGQLTENGNQCNQGGGIVPNNRSLCFPGGLGMDPYGNLFVSDFTLEIRGNYRLLEYDAGLFPKYPASTLYGIPASRVYGTNGSFARKGCEVPSKDPLCQPFEPAFNHSGQMVMGTNAYGPAFNGLRFPLIYQNPLNRTKPVDTLKDYYSMPSAAYFDNEDNLYVADRNRGRVLIYLADTKTISGNVGVAGATLTYLDGALNKFVTADANGTYILSVRNHWSGTITPTKPGFSFTPDHRDYTDVSLEQVGQNYANTQISYVITGTANVPGTILNYNDNGPKSVTVDKNGNYKILVPPGWSGTIKPSNVLARFKPPSRSYTDISADRNNHNYTPLQASLSALSLGSQDGWILSKNQATSQGGSMNVTGSILRLGDDAKQKRYISILSFKLDNLPNPDAITNVSLILKRHGYVGGVDPVSRFLGFGFDIHSSFGEPTLAIGDYEASYCSAFDTSTPAPVNDVYTFDITKSKMFMERCKITEGLMQIRMRLLMRTNADAIANYVSLYSSNSKIEADRPKLVITYYAP